MIRSPMLLVAVGKARGKTSRPANEGDVFGNLTVLSKMPFFQVPPGRNQTCKSVVCQCKCGKVIVQLITYLHQGRATGCGCFKGGLQKNVLKHGDARPGLHTNLYYAWSSMKRRCTKENATGYSNYGGKGITVCAEWFDYPTFKTWAMANGYKVGLSIDRIDPTKGYYPENCQWITPQENGRKVWTDMWERDRLLKERLDVLEASAASGFEYDESAAMRGIACLI